MKLSQRVRNKYEKYDEVVDELESLGINRDLIYENLRFSNITGGGGGKLKRDLPVFVALKRTSPIRKRMIDYMFTTLSNSAEVTQKGLFNAANTKKSEWTQKDYDEHYIFHAATFVKANAKKTQPPQKDRVRQYDKKIECDTVHRNILLRMNAAGYGDDEYAAFCIALKWAAERLEAEKAAKEVKQND